MQFLFLTAIRLYWLLIPMKNRRKCIFKESCSRYVYRICFDDGFVAGSKAFAFRFRNCRNGYMLFKNPVNGEMNALLASGIVVSGEIIVESPWIEDQIASDGQMTTENRKENIIL
jgi:uncharacterized protein